MPAVGDVLCTGKNSGSARVATVEGNEEQDVVNSSWPYKSPWDIQL